MSDREIQVWFVGRGTPLKLKTSEGWYWQIIHGGVLIVEKVAEGDVVERRAYKEWFTVEEREIEEFDPKANPGLFQYNKE